MLKTRTHAVNNRMRTERREGKGPSWGCTGKDTLGEGTRRGQEGLNKAHRTDRQTDRQPGHAGRAVLTPLLCRAGLGTGPGCGCFQSAGRGAQHRGYPGGEPPEKKFGNNERRGEERGGGAGGSAPSLLAATTPEVTPAPLPAACLQPHGRPRASFLPSST